MSSDYDYTKKTNPNMASDIGNNASPSPEAPSAPDKKSGNIFDEEATASYTEGSNPYSARDIDSRSIFLEDNNSPIYFNFEGRIDNTFSPANKEAQTLFSIFDVDKSGEISSDAIISNGNTFNEVDAMTQFINRYTVIKDGKRILTDAALQNMWQDITGFTTQSLSNIKNFFLKLSDNINIVQHRDIASTEDGILNYYTKYDGNLYTEHLVKFDGEELVPYATFDMLPEEVAQQGHYDDIQELNSGLSFIQYSDNEGEIHRGAKVCRVATFSEDAKKELRSEAVKYILDNAINNYETIKNYLKNVGFFDKVGMQAYGDVEENGLFKTVLSGVLNSPANIASSISYITTDDDIGIAEDWRNTVYDFLGIKDTDTYSYLYTEMIRQRAIVESLIGTQRTSYIDEKDIERAIENYARHNKDEHLLALYNFKDINTRYQTARELSDKAHTISDIIGNIKKEGEVFYKDSLQYKTVLDRLTTIFDGNQEFAQEYLDALFQNNIINDGSDGRIQKADGNAICEKLSECLSQLEGQLDTVLSKEIANLSNKHSEDVDIGWLRQHAITELYHKKQELEPQVQGIFKLNSEKIMETIEGSTQWAGRAKIASVIVVQSLLTAVTGGVSTSLTGIMGWLASGTLGTAEMFALNYGASLLNQGTSNNGLNWDNAKELFNEETQSLGFLSFASFISGPFASMVGKSIRTSGLTNAIFKAGQKSIKAGEMFKIIANNKSLLAGTATFTTEVGMFAGYDMVFNDANLSEALTGSAEMQMEMKLMGLMAQAITRTTVGTVKERLNSTKNIENSPVKDYEISETTKNGKTIYTCKDASGKLLCENENFDAVLAFVNKAAYQSSPAYQKQLKKAMEDIERESEKALNGAIKANENLDAVANEIFGNPYREQGVDENTIQNLFKNLKGVTIKKAGNKYIATTSDGKTFETTKASEFLELCNNVNTYVTLAPVNNLFDRSGNGEKTAIDILKEIHAGDTKYLNDINGNAILNCIKIKRVNGGFEVEFSGHKQTMNPQNLIVYLEAMSGQAKSIMKAAAKNNTRNAGGEVNPLDLFPYKPVREELEEEVYREDSTKPQEKTTPLGADDILDAIIDIDILELSQTVIEKLCDKAALSTRKIIEVLSPMGRLLNASNREAHLKLLSSINDIYGNPKYTEADINKILDNLPKDIDVKSRDIYALMTLPHITVDNAITILSKINSPEQLKILNAMTDTNDRVWALFRKSSDIPNNALNASEVDYLLDNIFGQDIEGIGDFYLSVIKQRDWEQNQTPACLYLLKLNDAIRSEKQITAYNKIKSTGKFSSMTCTDLCRYLNAVDIQYKHKSYDVSGEMQDLHKNISDKLDNMLKNKPDKLEEMKSLLAFVDDIKILEYIKNENNIENIRMLLCAATEYDGTLYYPSSAFFQSSDSQLEKFKTYLDNEHVDYERLLEYDIPAGIKSKNVLGIPLDMEMQGRFQHLREFIGRNPASEISNYLYNEYYLKTLHELGFSNHIVEKLKDIDNNYGVKIIVGADTTDFGTTMEFVENELKLWKDVSGGQAKYPPYIDFNSAQIDWYDNESAYGESAAAAYSYPAFEGSLSFSQQTVDQVSYSLRHELTHTNDLKKGYKIDNRYDIKRIMPKKEITNADGSKSIQIDFDKCMYKDEFKKIGIPKWHIEYAYNNTQEFIAVASEGDLSKCSPEFKEVLIAFGMPEWRFDFP